MEQTDNTQSPPNKDTESRNTQVVTPTLVKVKKAIEDIATFKFDPWGTEDAGPTTVKSTKEKEQVTSDPSLMMFSPQAMATELPELTMEKWPCDTTKKPNPITIRMARKILAAGHLQIPSCKMEEAGDHGWSGELLDHLSDTCAQPRDMRQHLEEVDMEFNAPHDPKSTVKAHFLKPQEAKAHAKLLGQPCTEWQIVDCALKEFQVHHEKDACKAKKKWNKKPGKERTWEVFKVCWKDKIHQWDTMCMQEGKGAQHHRCEWLSPVDLGPSSQKPQSAGGASANEVQAGDVGRTDQGPQQ